MQRLGHISAALVLAGAVGSSGCSEVEAHDRAPAREPNWDRAQPTATAGAPASPEPWVRPEPASELEFPRVRRTEPPFVGPVAAPSLAPTAARAPSAAAAARPKPAPAAPLPAKRVDLVVVDISDQRLDLLADGAVVRSYAVSTAKNGVGSQAGSERTPLGRHRVHKKIGAGEPLGRVFEARAATRRVATIHTDPVDLPEDVITSRILWLEGLEQGKNRGRGVDSRERYIYIHGTNEEGLIGLPASHGCVRMRNRDVIELFELVGEGTAVEIVP